MKKIFKKITNILIVMLSITIIAYISWSIFVPIYLVSVVNNFPTSSQHQPSENIKAIKNYYSNIYQYDLEFLDCQEADISDYFVNKDSRKEYEPVVYHFYFSDNPDIVFDIFIGKFHILFPDGMDIYHDNIEDTLKNNILKNHQAENINLNQISVDSAAQLIFDIQSDYINTINKYYYNHQNSSLTLNIYFNNHVEKIEFQQHDINYIESQLNNFLN